MSTEDVSKMKNERKRKSRNEKKDKQKWDDAIAHIGHIASEVICNPMAYSYFCFITDFLFSLEDSLFEQKYENEIDI